MRPRLAEAALGAIALLALPPAASAAQRFAAPSGTGTVCSAAERCDLATAITGPGIAAGDEVILAPGDYGTPAAPITSTITRSLRITLRGEDPAARPRIWLGTAATGSTLTGLVLAGTANVVRDVEVHNVVTGVGGQALFVGGSATVDHVVASVAGLSSTSPAVVGYALAGNSGTVVNTVARSTSTAPGGTTFPASAIVYENGGGGVTFRHVTALARGSGTFAMDLVGVGPNPSSFVVVNTLVAGNGASVVVRRNTSGTTTGSYTTSVVNTAPQTLGTGVTTSGTPTVADAALVDPDAGDVRQLPTSTATIDQGGSNPGGVVTDIGGDPRVLRTAPDVGADEIPPPPVATVDTVEAISDSGATVKGSVDPAGGRTTFRLEFGAATAFDRQLPGAAALLAGSAPQQSTFTLTGLAADTVHQARLVATSDGGTTTSPPFAFRTGPTPAPSPTPAPTPAASPAPTPAATPQPVPTATPTPTSAARKVTCAQARRASGKGRARRFAITCTVRPAVPRSAVTLKRGRTVVARGTTASGRLTFRVRKRLRAGRYVVTLKIAGRATSFTVALR